MLSNEALHAFRMSWRNHQSDAFSDRLARQSLTSLAVDVPELREILREENNE